MAKKMKTDTLFVACVDGSWRFQDICEVSFVQDVKKEKECQKGYTSFDYGKESKD